MNGVVRTASDAIICKQSLINAGYSIEHKSQQQTYQTKRSALTNRLYFARCKVVLRCVDMLSSIHSSCQLLVLGSGHDETYTSSQKGNIYYVDLPAVIPTCSSEHNVHKISCNLNNPSALFPLLTSHHFDYSQPTIVIFECVLGYLNANASQALLTDLQRRIPHCAIVLYDPIAAPTSSYTSSLLAHFTSHNAALHSIFPTSYALYSCFRVAGYNHILTMNMHQAMELLLSSQERRISSTIEPFDEFAALAALHRMYHTSIITNDHTIFHTLLHRIHEIGTSAEKQRIRLEILSHRVQCIEMHQQEREKQNALAPISVIPAQRCHLEAIIRLQKDVRDLFVFV